MCVCVCAMVCVHVRACMCVCVCERERERERQQCHILCCGKTCLLTQGQVVHVFICLAYQRDLA